MKRGRKLLVLLTAVSAILFLPSVLARNGIQFIEFDFEEEPPGLYVECLGEYTLGHLYVTAATHEFETPSGTYHYIDHWRYTVVLTGVSTGRTWIGRGVSPWVENIGPGETVQWAVKEMMKPLTGDGPKFMSKQAFKVTVTANGDLIVLREPPEEYSDSTRCLGQK